MRFVRVYTRTDTGEVVAVSEQEMPFDREQMKLNPPLDPATGLPQFEIEMHELGLASDFAPSDVETGDRCSPSQHLFQRIERVPDSADHAASDLSASPLTRFRAKLGLEDQVLEIMDVPTTLSGLNRRLLAGHRLPAAARAWLTLMLPPDQVEAMGVGKGIPVSVINALDSMRQRRDPSVGSRRIVHERAAEEQAKARADRIERRKTLAAAKAAERKANGNAPLRQAHPDDLRIDDRPGGLPGD